MQALKKKIIKVNTKYSTQVPSRTQKYIKLYFCILNKALSFFKQIKNSIVIIKKKTSKIDLVTDLLISLVSKIFISLTINTFLFPFIFVYLSVPYY